MANNNISNGPSEKGKINVESSVDSKREILKNSIKNSLESKIEMLRKGKERVKEYAEEEKKKRINSANDAHQRNIKEIESKYEEIELSNDLSKLSIYLSLSDEEKGKIREILNISEEKEDVKIKKLNEMKKEIESENKRYNKEIEKIENSYRDFVKRYDTIFEDRISTNKVKAEKLLKKIESSDNETIEKMFVNYKMKNDKENTKDISTPRKKHLLDRAMPFALTVLTLGSIFIAYDEFRTKTIPLETVRKEAVIERKETPVISIKNQNSQIYIKTQPIDNIQVIQSTSPVSSKSEATEKKNIEQKVNVEQKVTPKEQKVNPKQEIKNPKPIVKQSSQEISLDKEIKSLKEKAKELKYDGIPIFKGSSESHIIKFAEKIEELDKQMQLSLNQKRSLQKLMNQIEKSIDLYLIGLKFYKKDAIPDEVNEIKKDIVKYIKWLRSQNFNEDAIEYLIKHWQKTLYPKHKRSVKIKK